jgi:5-dehydro-2-deoxygluconokinase
VPAYDLVAIGRIGVDLYPEQIGVPLERVRSFRKMLGGSATNVAVAAARNGRRAAIITRVGDDGFGRFCREAVAEFGLEDRYVSVHPTLRTPLAFCEIHPPDDFPLLFYREPRAPDLELTVDELDRTAIEAAGVLWTTGTGLSVEPSRTTTLTAMSWRAPDAITVHDLDHRPRPAARPSREPRSRSATARRRRWSWGRASRASSPAACWTSASGWPSSSSVLAACWR